MSEDPVHFAPGRLQDRCCAPGVPLLPAGSGSRRLRLWDLPAHAHCPALGVGLPLDLLRRLSQRDLGAALPEDDYGLHCAAVAQCRVRSPLAERLQKALDQRYALSLQRAARLKDTEALAAWWRTQADGPDLAGAFWALLTHPRCDEPLRERVLGEIHMRQHQLGAGQRADQARLESLTAENAVLTRELARVQQRATRAAAEQAAALAAAERALLAARAEAIARTTALALLRERVAQLEAAQPDLGTRLALAAENRALIGRVQDLQRALTAAREATRPEPAPAAAPAPAPAPAATPAPPALADRAVLCVGGRTSAVPLYRRLVERTGGRFLHHDGGAEENVARLEATLAAADLVICQTGCISHDAYWRVKDHCRRTGKRCLFVESPSRSALERALAGDDGA